MRSKILLEKALSIYTVDQLYDFTVKASNYYDKGLQPDIALVAVFNYPGVLSTMNNLLGDNLELVADNISKKFE